MQQLVGLIMGIFICQCTLADGKWIKLCHHQVTEIRDNPYFRVYRKGFGRCKCPEELAGKVEVGNVGILHWFPKNNHGEILNTKDEKSLNEILKEKYTFVGEWYLHSDLQDIYDDIYMYGGREESVVPLTAEQVNSLPPDKQRHKNFWVSNDGEKRRYKKK